jgi:WD40 repeat protein
MQYKKGVIWNLSTNTVVSLVGHEDFITSARFNLNGRFVVTAADDGSARVWDVATGAQLAVIKFKAGKTTAASFSRDGSQLLIASEDGKARIWDWKSDQKIVEMAGHAKSLSGAEFSPSDEQVLTTSWDSTARLFDVATGRTAAVFAGHSDGIISGTFSSDGRHIATGGSDGTVRLWRAETSIEQTIGKHLGEVHAVAFSPDGQRVVSASQDKTAKIWSAGDGALIRSLDGHANAVWHAEFSRDNRLIATASEDKMARVWHLDREEPPVVLQGHQGLVWQVTLSADARFAATRSADGSVRVWEASSGVQVMALEGFSNLPARIAFAPDANLLATAIGDTIDIWDVVTRSKVTSLRHAGANFEKLAFDASGQRLLAKTSARSVVAWNWKTGAEDGTLSNAVVYAFSADGRMAVGKEFDGNHDLRLWDIANNKDVAILDGTAGVDGQVAFSPDGLKIALPQKNGTIKIMEVFASPQELVDRAKRTVPNCLTGQQRQDAFMGAEPPDWCITGAYHDAELDPAKWEPKWPYKTEVWKHWLAEKRQGRTSALPSEKRTKASWDSPSAPGGARQ